MVGQPTTRTIPLKERTVTPIIQERLVAMTTHPMATMVHHSTTLLDHFNRSLMGHLHLVTTTTAAAVRTLDRIQRMDDHNRIMHLNRKELLPTRTNLCNTARSTTAP